MLRILVLLVLLMHGLIHLLGFVKAFEFAEVSALTRAISRPVGIAWGTTAVLFLITLVLLYFRFDKWWIIGGIAIILSQVLIVNYWQDARYGTMANVVLAFVVVSAGASWKFHEQYLNAVTHSVQRSLTVSECRITEADLTRLPDPVQRFLRSAGVVGTLRPRNMRIRLTGSIRGFSGPWMPLEAEQTNSFDTPSRFFWMNATMNGLPVRGLHAYDDGKASMLVKLLGLIPVANESGAIMNTTETVTWFNEVCLFAPGALIDPRVSWTAIDDHSARATFTHNGISISAVLVFDGSDRIVNFISDDRYSMGEDPPTKRQFSTPAKNHRLFNGILIPSYGEGVWAMPDGPFSYGRFNVVSIAYDVDKS